MPADGLPDTWAGRTCRLSKLSPLATHRKGEIKFKSISSLPQRGFMEGIAQ
jgi:hypothetical protein